MLIAVAVLAIASVAALIAAMVLDSGIIAGACACLCLIALLMLIIDARRAPRRPEPSQIEPNLPEEHHHTAGDELFGEHDVERDLLREERVLNPDMLEQDVPSEEGQRY
jgi:hypothetical protein